MEDHSPTIANMSPHYILFTNVENAKTKALQWFEENRVSIAARFKMYFIIS
jgi:post-segregation antitoxin (ccd killing protein)